MTNTSYKEYRCLTCNKLLFKGSLEVAEVEIKCKHCKNINKYTGEKNSETRE